jgi:hypothetical protein
MICASYMMVHSTVLDIFILFICGTNMYIGKYSDYKFLRSVTKIIMGTCLVIFFYTVKIEFNSMFILIIYFLLLRFVFSFQIKSMNDLVDDNLLICILNTLAEIIIPFGEVLIFILCIHILFYTDTIIQHYCYRSP